MKGIVIIMVRMIVNRTKLPHRKRMGIMCGVSVDTLHNKVTFNWNHDKMNSNIITLKQDCCGEYTNAGVKYIYGYSYLPSADESDKQYFRRFIKGKIFKDVWYREDVLDFIDHGVLNIERYIKFSDIGAIINIKSDSKISVTDIIGNYIDDYTKCKEYGFHLLKQACEHITFDAELAYKALIDAGVSKANAERKVKIAQETFDDLKAKNKTFQMKFFSPRELRSGFMNFLKFKTQEEEDLYRTLQGVNVLVYDDFITSGSTLREATSYLTSINPNNQLIAFALVKQ